MHTKYAHKNVYFHGYLIQRHFCIIEATKINNVSEPR